MTSGRASPSTSVRKRAGAKVSWSPEAEVNRKKADKIGQMSDCDHEEVSGDASGEGSNSEGDNKNKKGMTRTLRERMTNGMPRLKGVVIMLLIKKIRTHVMKRVMKRVMTIAVAIVVTMVMLIVATIMIAI